MPTYTIGFRVPIPEPLLPVGDVTQPLGDGR